jgi:hypothetical protein
LYESTISSKPAALIGLHAFDISTQLERITQAHALEHKLFLAFQLLSLNQLGLAQLREHGCPHVDIGEVCSDNTLLLM